MGEKPASGDDRLKGTETGPTVLCKCGHDLAAHSGTSVSGVPCKVCGVTRVPSGQRFYTGFCMRWSPNGRSEGLERRRRPDGTFGSALERAVEERFWSKVDRTGACWIWTGRRDAYGYGVFKVDRRNLGAHRWLYEQVVGLIPSELETD